MHLFGWLDLRTLVACQVPLAVVFALTLFAVQRVYPHLRGIGLLASSFALWIPATILVAAQGAMPAFLSTIGGSLLAIGCYILLYKGILAFTNSRGVLPLFYDVTSVAAAVIVYFTVIYDVFTPRIVALSLVAALARGLVSVELLAKARSNARSKASSEPGAERSAEAASHPTSRPSATLLAFAGFLAVFTVLPVSTALLSDFHAATLTRGGLEAFDTLANFAFLGGSGLCALFLFLDEAREKTLQQGQFDFITGTLNRNAIEEALTVEIARSARTHSPVSVMLVEIDRFSTLSAIHGHDKADQTLCTVVSTIGNMLRFYDKCGRVAEDRFLVLLPENVAEHAMVIATRFREALKSPALPHDQPAVTLTIGVTQANLKELTADVLARAESALLQARANGRDCAHLAYDSHQHLQAAHLTQSATMDHLASRTRVAAKASR